MNRLTEKGSKTYYLQDAGPRLKKATIKLGQLEDIEEEYHITLDMFTQIISKGIWVKSDTTKWKLEYWSPQEIKIVYAGTQTDICKINSKTNKYVGTFNFKKTWAFTKEELLFNEKPNVEFEDAKQVKIGKKENN